jgi:hypothetical protein
MDRIICHMFLIIISGLTNIAFSSLNDTYIYLSGICCSIHSPRYVFTLKFLRSTKCIQSWYLSCIVLKKQVVDGT